jgi:hypothetical protein
MSCLSGPLTSTCYIAPPNLATAEYGSHYKSELVAKLQQTLEVLVLPKRCLQLTLETISANMFTPADSTIADNGVPCGNSCSFCLGDYSRIFPKVRRLGVQQVLLVYCFWDG